MKKIVRLVFDNEDKELLMKPLPKSPCKECSYRFVSCDSKSSCEKMRNYEKSIQDYTSRGILDIAEKISERKELKEKIKKDEETLKEVEKNLPDFVLGNENPFRTDFYQKSLRDSNTITGNEFGVTIQEDGKTLVYLEEIQRLIDAGALKVDYDALEDYIFNTRVNS